MCFMWEGLEMSEGMCPRRHTCAMLECPENWIECGVPSVLNTVSEWLYSDKICG